MSRADQEKRRPEKIAGFDVARLLFSLFIVSAHDMLLGAYTKPDTIAITDDFVPTMKDIVYHNVFYMAVPVFYTISLLLYFQNREYKPGYAVSRLKHLGALFLFWMSVYYAYRMILIFRGVAFPFSHFQGIHIIKTIIFGGNTNYYFLFSLVFVTFIAELYISAMERWDVQSRLPHALFLCACLILFYMGPFIPLYAQYAVHDYNPVNFLPYIFTALLLRGLLDSKESLTIVLFFVFIAYVAFVVVEWKYLSYQRTTFWRDADLLVPTYTRISPVFGSFFIVAVLAQIRSVPAIISGLAAYSLGIYCLQQYLPIDYILSIFYHSRDLIPGRIAIVMSGKILLLIIITHQLRSIPFFKRFA